VYGHAETMVQLLRSMNHDYLNHFQVISGYLQLGRAQQALLYIKETVTAMHQRSALFRLPYPAVVLLLLQWQLKFREQGRVLNIECETDLKDAGLSDQELQQLLSLVLCLVQAGPTGAGTENWVLRLAEHGEGYLVEIGSPDAPWPQEDWARLGQQVQALGYGVETVREDPFHALRCSLPKKASWRVAE